MAMLLLGLRQLTTLDRGTQKAPLLPACPQKTERGQDFLLHKAGIRLERSSGVLRLRSNGNQSITNSTTFYYLLNHSIKLL